jgi:hypothetical protein
MSQSESKKKRAAELEDREAENTPIGEITIKVYQDGHTTVHNFPPELRACMHVMADAMAFCAGLFATQGQMAPKPEPSRIIKPGMVPPDNMLKGTVLSK